MQYAVNREEIIDFKEPLSPNMDRRSSMGSGPPHYPSHARPPLNISATFGLMGEIGIFVSVLLFFLDMASDILLLIALWNQANGEPNYYKHKEEKSWFFITLLIILIPTIIINILSLAWYALNRQVLGVQGVYYKKTLGEKILCVIMHFLLLGPVIRYFDVLKYGKKMKIHLVEVNRGTRGSVQRLTTKGEVNSALQMVIAKDTAVVGMIHSFFQDCPQLVFQIYLLYKNPLAVTGEFKRVQLTQVAQIFKILIALFSVSWILTSYQDELRRIVPGKRQLSCSATSACLLWRASLIGSRVIAIGSFAALQANGEGGLLKMHSDYYSSTGSLMPSLPIITFGILTVHFLIMLIWICTQKTSFCNSYEGTPKPVTEIFYNIMMSWVHVFSYLNIKDAPSRRRMTFFYIVLFIENTGFITVWFLQSISKELWLRVTILFSVESLFVIGISSAIGYYSFLHPGRNSVRQLHASWKT